MRSTFRALAALAALAAPLRAGAGISDLGGAVGDAADGGAFGAWVFPDVFGGVAFNYTMDQTADPRAVNDDVNPYFRSTTEHNFVVANSRLTAHASNFGFLQVRRDERTAEWLSEAAAACDGGASPQWGLGWGYLLDTEANRSALSTFYEGAGGALQERLFGMGYASKAAAEPAGGGGLRARQTVVAPFGDDPVLVSTVTVTNTGSSPRSIAWVESAGGALRNMDRLSSVAGLAGRASVFSDPRAFAEAHYASTFVPVSVAGAAAGLAQVRAWAPLNASEQALLAALTAEIAQRTADDAFDGPPMELPPPGSAMWDEQPPTSYVLDISPPSRARRQGPAAAAFGTDCAAFFGAGGRAAPDGLRAPLELPQAAQPAKNSVGCILAARSALLSPGESVTFAFLWAAGAGGDGDSDALARYVAAYAPLVAADALVATTVAAWLNVSTRFNGSGVAPWAERETLWNSYMALSTATFDEGFGEHILDQGTAYRYVSGFQGAMRDPAQHLLPAVYAQPWLAKSVLRFLLKTVQRGPDAYNGSSVIGGAPFNLPYMTVNTYQIGGIALRPSDQELYVMLAAAEYVLATRDTAFLDEQFPLYGDRFREPAAANVTVGDALLRCLSYSLVNVSVGQHGLMRSLTSDWDDALCTALQKNCSGPESDVWKNFTERGESVLNAAMATFVLPLFAEALAATGDPRFAGAIADARAFAAGQVAALSAAGWNSNRTWLRRAFLSDETGWLGEDEIFGIQHAWAFLSGAVAGADAVAAAAQLDAHLRAPSPIGMLIEAPPLPSSAVGEGENGGVWPSLNFPTAMSFAVFNSTLAWSEWSKGSLRAAALAYPSYYAAIWSSSDSLNGALAQPDRRGRNGAWTTGWPTQCTHRHAWPIYALLKLATGATFDAAGLSLRPVATVEQAAAATAGGAGGAWAVSTPLLSVRREGPRRWAGHWAPGRSATGPLALGGTFPVDAAPEAACEWSVLCSGAEGGSAELVRHVLAPRAMTADEAARLGSPAAAMVDARSEPLRCDGGGIQWALQCGE